MFSKNNIYMEEEKEYIRDGITYNTFIFKLYNDEGITVRTARDQDYHIPHRFTTGLNIDKDQPFEIFFILFGYEEMGDPFKMDHSRGNLPYLSRDQVIEVMDNIIKGNGNIYDL